MRCWMGSFQEIKRDGMPLRAELRDKAVLLYGFSDQQVNELMDWYKEKKFPNAVFGIITPVTQHKRVKDIVRDLVAEQQGTQGKPPQ